MIKKIAQSPSVLSDSGSKDSRLKAESKRAYAAVMAHGAWRIAHRAKEYNSKLKAQRPWVLSGTVQV
jgi:hypothetical protein